MPPTHQLQSIQLLRAVAAISVVVYHALDISFRTGWKLGAIGVDAFFVISGFVMYVSTHDGTNAARFLVRRLWRIYPLYWIATLAYLAVAVWMLGAIFPAEHIARSFALIPTRAPWAFPVLFPAWTLTYELVFYGCLAVAIALTHSRNRAALLTGAVVVSIGLLEFAMQPTGFLPPPFSRILHIGPWDDAVSNAFRMSEFALGLLGAYFWNRGHVLPRSVALLVLVVAVACLVLYPLDNPTGLRPLIIWGLPSVAIVYSLVSLEASGIDFDRPVIRVLGDSSYAIYLFHPMVLAVLFTLIAPPGAAMASIRIPELWFFALLVGGSVAFGCLAWWLIDRPLQQLRRRINGTGSVSSRNPG